MSVINTPLTLPCGATLPNRLAKAAMSENMARSLSPGVEFVNAYKMWAGGGTGLLISGNVMVDSQHLGEPNNVIIEKGRDNFDQLKKWARSVEGTDTKIWLQINHPGKQSRGFLNKRPVAPSAIPFQSRLKDAFNTPRALEEKEIYEIIDRFGYAAKVAKDCGFHGVQIHGAHGYLVSQFLSPLHNNRTDDFGGSLENRMRFVKEVYLKMRAEAGKDFPIGLKINSADFAKGGFTNEEAVEVAKTLSTLGIDLLEISGGTYESPAMTGVMKESTKRREAYFLEYTKEIKKVINCPLMVTGGFRTREFIEDVLNDGELDLVGMARPLALDPNLSNSLLNGKNIESQVKPLSTGFKKLDKAFPLEIIWYTDQIHRMGKNKIPNPKASVFGTIVKTVVGVGMASLRRVRA